MLHDFDRLIERRGTDSIKWGRYHEDVLPMWVADMDFASPPAVVEALSRRVEHGVFGYGAEPAELRTTIQERMERLYRWSVSPEDILFLPGVVVGFNLAARAFGSPGDGVLVQPPGYPPFFMVGHNARQTIVEAPLTLGQGGYSIDFEAFEAAITPQTRLFILCNPHNPVGRVFTRGELEKMAEICLRHGVIICSDEIHQDFIYPGHNHVPIASLSPEVAARTITLSSPSKSFNIAGFHFSAAIVQDREMRRRMEESQAGLIPRLPGLFDLVAGLAAYQSGDPWLGGLIHYLDRNRNLVMDFVAREMPGVKMHRPEGSYLGWLDCRGLGLEEPPCEFFLREARVGLMDGSAFGTGGKGFVRLNFGCPGGVLEEGLGRMKAALARGSAGSNL